jgi:hypothetical protein
MSRVGGGKHRRRSELKLILTLIMLRLKGPLGRYRLKEMLNLSEQEGIVRLMLSDLKQEDFIKAGRIGCELTQKGEELLESLQSKYGLVDIREMNLEPLKIGPESFVLQIRGHSFPKSIAVLRDVAVRSGASGAVIIAYEKGVFRVPEIYSNLGNEYPGLVADFRKTLTLHDGDVIIACFSRDKWRALEGGLSAAAVLAGF